MGWCQPTSCCFCLSPRTGTLILGYMGVLTAAIGLLITLVDAIGNKNLPLVEVLSVEEVVRAAVCVWLIQGVTKEKSSMMLPYMLLKGLVILIMCIGFPGLSIYLGVHGLWKESAICAAVGAFVIGITTYCYKVVDVVYEEIKQLEKASMDPECNIAYNQFQNAPTDNNFTRF
ncbi:hypothetical protein SK128_008983 [Halocaridina rubra]|uniref:Uncharacterized protein n=1 Tax=Halocaridina rubra TaxID=373956 RepID=A0AAN8WN84_HALRR